MSSFNKRILSAFALLAALPAAAQLPDETAKREHFFPLVADGGGFRSYLFLTNAADAANRCALALQGPNLDTGIFEANDAVTPAGAGATIALLGAGANLTLISTAEQALTFGYATLECAEPVVARMLLTLSDNGSSIAMTALESTQAGREFQFSVLPRLGRLGLLFSNDNSVAAACAVELEDAEGASAGGGNVALPAQSTALQFLGDLIPIPDGFDTGVVTLSCNEAIAALGLPLNGATFTALPAISLDSGNTAQASHILPLVVDGGGFQSQLLVTNLAETANQCTMNLLGAGLDSGRFTNSDGVTAAGSGATLELMDKGDTLSMLGSGEQALAFGYATLDCDQPATALNLLSVSAQGSPVGMAVIPGSRTAGSFAFPVVPQAGRLALVFTNDADTGASCTIELNDHEGGNAGRQSVPIAAKSTALRFLADLFDRVDEFPGGEAAVFCDPEVDAISLSLSGAVFAALPPTIFSSIELAPDLAPDFGNISLPQKEVYPRGAPIEPLQLPAAFGGNAPLRYSLEPAVPGLRFDAVTRQLTGTPTAAEVYKMHYLVEDADGDSDTHQFEISIVEPPASPSFADVSAPPDQIYTLGKEIEPLQLPTAFGGDATIFYLLEPEVPGLEFDSETRQLSGAPAATGVYTMSYSARDKDSDADTLEFTITVVVPVTSESLINVNGCSDGSFVNNPNGNPELVSDCESLVGFANALIETGLNAEDNVIRQWGSGDQVKLDTWDGIGVSGSRVTWINLQGRELKGDFPPHLGELSALTNLYLGTNELSGPIPLELGALTELRNLSLGSNQLSGPIPAELGALTELGYLYLSDNQLSGPIPAELGALTELTSLSLENNQLGGPIPSELGALTELRYLHLRNNQLSGSIPAELGALTELTSLVLGNNQLSGPIPSELGALTELTSLRLGNNQLSGPIPSELGVLTKLEVLELNDNQLSGPIPSELGALDKLTRLSLERNQLSGGIPAALQAICNNTASLRSGLRCEFLDSHGPASFADVSAPPDQIYTLGKEIEPLQLPAAFGGFPPIVYLLEPEVPGLEFDSETRQLSGAPSATGVYTMSYSAKDKDSDADTLEFTITVVVPVTSESLINVNGCSDGSFVNNPNGNPELVSDCKSLAGFANALIEIGLNAEDNVIRQWGSGDQVKLDTWDGIGVSGSRVTWINLHGRELKGEFPPHLGELSALTNLNLNRNELSGPIPAELGALTELTSLSLYNNQLSGPIPSELGALTNLTYLRLSNNQLSGSIPSELGALTELTSLSLGNNQLSGPIPSELGELTELRNLGLYNNQLSGPIPSELGALTNLTYLRLSNNQLSGPIPPKLGALTKLTSLSLRNNQLSGSIPVELGALTELTNLDLSTNQLSGPIPAELGALDKLTSLNLGNSHPSIGKNQLSGPIPAELGALTELTNLDLWYNQMSGPIPAELGALTELRHLNLGYNPQLSGPIPPELAGLSKLEYLNISVSHLHGTLPWDFRERVIQGSLRLLYGRTLVSGYAALPARIRNPAYSPEAAENGNAAHHSISYFQGPLLLEWDWQGERVEHQTPILGRWAGLAVSIDHAVEEPPLVISRILDARNIVLVESLAEAAPPVTEEIAPGQWRTEYMFYLPGELFQSGNQIVHVIDPDDELAETDETDNVAEPIVVYGEQPPKFRVTFIPVQLATQEEFSWIDELDPELLMAGTLAFLPIADDFEARIGPPLRVATRSEVIGKMQELWNLEAGPDEFYHGIVMNKSVDGVGQASGRWVAQSDLYGVHGIIPHEFGHNLTLRHTPGCGAATVDENYPYPNGQLGPERGWELHWRQFISGENEDYGDVMSYCTGNGFISDYNYRLASEYWLSLGNETSTSMVTTAPLVEGEGYTPDPVSGEGSGANSSQAASTSADSASIALSGRIGAAGAWSLTQAQLSRRAPRAPRAEGSYTLILFDGAGIQVYGEPLTIMELSDGDESFWAARTPIPLRTAREIVILDARGVEVLRQPLPELE